MKHPRYRVTFTPGNTYRMGGVRTIDTGLTKTAALQCLRDAASSWRSGYLPSPVPGKLCRDDVGTWSSRRTAAKMEPTRYRLRRNNDPVGVLKAEPIEPGA